jgi:Cell cycle protein
MCGIIKKIGSTHSYILKATPWEPAITYFSQKLYLAPVGFWVKVFYTVPRVIQTSYRKHIRTLYLPLWQKEFGLVGGLLLMGLYATMILYGLVIALRSRNRFGRLLGLGIVKNLFLYVFINIAMVAGLIPVVGVPLPLISFGGTAMLTVMFGVGLLMSVHTDRDVRLNRRGEAQPS